MNNVSNTPKSAEFYEIYTYYTTPFYQTTTGRILIGLCVLSVLVIVIYTIIAHRKKKTLAPWEWATQELSRIKLDTCKNKDDYKKFYFTLSGIIKKYLHKRFLWATEDKTDDELLVLLQEKKFDMASLDMIKQISQGALSVKFANEDVLKTQAENDLQTMLKIITQTIPEIETQPSPRLRRARQVQDDNMEKI